MRTFHHSKRSNLSFVVALALTVLSGCPKEPPVVDPDPAPKSVPAPAPSPVDENEKWLMAEPGCDPRNQWAEVFKVAQTGPIYDAGSAEYFYLSSYIEAVIMTKPLSETCKKNWYAFAYSQLLAALDHAVNEDVAEFPSSKSHAVDEPVFPCTDGKCEYCQPAIYLDQKIEKWRRCTAAYSKVQARFGLTGYISMPRTSRLLTRVCHCEHLPVLEQDTCALTKETDLMIKVMDEFRKESYQQMNGYLDSKDQP